MGKKLSPLELELISNLDNFSFHELSETEKKAIRNPEDYPIISTIDGLSKKDLSMINRAIFIDSKNHELFHEYMDEEKPWVTDFQHYYGENHKDLVDAVHTTSFCDEFKHSNLCKRYRLYFAAKHPNKIEILKKYKGYEKANIFLSLVKEEMRIAKEELSN